MGTDPCRCGGRCAGPKGPERAPARPRFVLPGSAATEPTLPFALAAPARSRGSGGPLARGHTPPSSTTPPEPAPAAETGHGHDGLETQGARRCPSAGTDVPPAPDFESDSAGSGHEGRAASPEGVEMAGNEGAPATASLEEAGAAAGSFPTDPSSGAAAAMEVSQPTEVAGVEERPVIDETVGMESAEAVNVKTSGTACGAAGSSNTSTNDSADEIERSTTASQASLDTPMVARELAAIDTSAAPSRHDKGSEESNAAADLVPEALTSRETSTEAVTATIDRLDVINREDECNCETWNEASEVNIAADEQSASESNRSSSSAAALGIVVGSSGLSVGADNAELCASSATLSSDFGAGQNVISLDAVFFESYPADAVVETGTGDKTSLQDQENRNPENLSLQISPTDSKNDVSSATAISLLNDDDASAAWQSVSTAESKLSTTESKLAERFEEETLDNIATNVQSLPVEKSAQEGQEDERKCTLHHEQHSESIEIEKAKPANSPSLKQEVPKSYAPLAISTPALDAKSAGMYSVNEDQQCNKKDLIPNSNSEENRDVSQALIEGEKVCSEHLTTVKCAQNGSSSTNLQKLQLQIAISQGTDKSELENAIMMDLDIATSNDTLETLNHAIGENATRSRTCSPGGEINMQQDLLLAEIPQVSHEVAHAELKVKEDKVAHRPSDRVDFGEQGGMNSSIQSDTDAPVVSRMSVTNFSDSESRSQPKTDNIRSNTDITVLGSEKMLNIDCSISSCPRAGDSNMEQLSNSLLVTETNVSNSEAPAIDIVIIELVPSHSQAAQNQMDVDNQISSATASDHSALQAVSEPTADTYAGLSEAHANTASNPLDFTQRVTSDAHGARSENPDIGLRKISSCSSAGLAQISHALTESDCAIHPEQNMIPEEAVCHESKSVRAPAFPVDEDSKASATNLTTDCCGERQGTSIKTQNIESCKAVEGEVCKTDFDSSCTAEDVTTPKRITAVDQMCRTENDGQDTATSEGSFGCSSTVEGSCKSKGAEAPLYDRAKVITY